MPYFFIFHTNIVPIDIVPIYFFFYEINLIVATKIKSSFVMLAERIICDADVLRLEIRAVTM